MWGIVAGLALLSAADARALTFEVNGTGDQSDLTPNSSCDALPSPGIQCTLRAAIEEANATGGDDDITFNIPGTGVQTLTPATSYPAMTGKTTLNGYTQAGSAANTQPSPKPLDTVLRIEIDGSGIASFGHIFRFNAGSTDSSVRGFVIRNTTGTAVFADSGVAVEVKGNFIGTDVTGATAEPNGETFFSQGGPSAGVIGGGNPADRNVLVGQFAAIKANATVTVEGNFIGTGADGKTVLASFLQTPVNLTGITGSNVVIGNVIAGSPDAAVGTSNNPDATLFSRNLTFGNPGLGFDLALGTGVTENDEPEADGFQNFPVITSAERKGSNTKIKGELTSLPETDYTIELFEAEGKARRSKRLWARSR